MTVLAVVLGAAVGAPLRYLVERWLMRPSGPPWGLFAVNVAGSALAGAVVALATGDLRTLLLVGLCGPFTTFSGYSWASVRLWPDERGAFWITVLGMPIACVAAAWAAWALAGLA